MPVNSFLDYPLSWKPDKTQLKRPLYLALADLLEQDITHSRLAPGTKLPPQRELADYLDIHFTTVTRTYKLCERKGLIYAVVGSGTFVSPNAARSITISLDGTPQEYIELGFVASFEQCNSMVTPAAQKVAEKKYLSHLFNYDHPTGMPHQKLAGLNWMKGLGIQAEPQQTAIVSGTLNGLAVTLFALFEPGSRIAVDQFTYSNFIELAKTLHIQLVPIDGDLEGMSAEALENQCRLTDIRGLYLMPSCCNPTTVMISQRRKLELAEVIRKQKLILIEDDIHAFLTAGILSDYHQPMYQLVPEHTVYICGTSKSLCSGLRIAYMVFGEAFRQPIQQAIFNINVKSSALDGEVITELILSGRAYEIVAEKRRLALQANDLFYSFFPASDLPHHSPFRLGHPLSFFRWLPIPADRQVPQLLENLQSRGVRVFDSNRFVTAPHGQEHYLRVALSSTKSLDELAQGLAVLREVLWT
ncbi:PLP-dependent aminotransferase family protein [Aminipila butyrica]|uniref:PLP-dependent aminotransferase family protein n=1 Tax=Aminipila butyrica TaxID=433296 RepID=A0A858BS54_9FIRM|nr:PLP-dependent aminotransferase family protein [Aminipila butyrica]QIB68743.1 PLP-dependent aminotransferase family protein [Aminipila butyrica]